ncbi:hypothetical protein DL769_007640 [Monosporascus sp. CRB-8-3]|nr:hypothetical protein DL769_007640 [Monosporascus sp. CRB-8-3]
MEDWKSKATHVKSRCGFCGETFTVWSDRNDHLSDHFRSGARMKDWKGCRGLEPAVALLVQNAIPPYLIGTESNDFEPFSASRARSGREGSGEQLSPTTFESLTACLGEFVMTARGNGTAITDDLLRTHARLLLYGDDDPLNHTPADNAEWLTLFKNGYGLLPSSPSQAGLQETVNTMQISPNSSPTLFTTPFTAEKMQQAAPFEFRYGSTDYEMAVPRSWQTPECLAEFSQMRQMPQPTMSQGDLDIVGPSCTAMTAVDPGLNEEPHCAEGLSPSSLPNQHITYGMVLHSRIDVAKVALVEKRDAF